MARPTILTAALTDRLIELIASGNSLRKICAADDMPGRTTVYRWIAQDEKGLAAQVERAREIGCDMIADECLDIADTPLIGEETITKADGSKEVRRGDMLGHRKLQIETRMKLLAKLMPKKYGDLQKIEHSGTIDIVATLNAARMRSRIVAAADERIKLA